VAISKECVFARQGPNSPPVFFVYTCFLLIWLVEVAGVEG